MSNQKSIKKNYYLNLIKTASALLFPLITFTYASRVLMADGIGKVNFSESIAAYFCLLAGLGIRNYGIREAAKLRDSKENLSRFAHEMLIINLISTFIAYILFFILIFNIDKFDNYIGLLLIHGLTIGLTSLGMEWLFNALEEYKFITTRTILFQIIAIILMLIFVKDKGDFKIYALLMVFATSGSFILNFIHSWHYISIKPFKDYQFRRHFKPILMLFAMVVSINLYTSLDSTMLGFISGDKSVGLYSAGVRINKWASLLIMSFGVVVMPRMSYYLSLKNHDGFESLVKNAFRYIFNFSTLIFTLMFLLSDELIYIFSGEDFVSAGLTMRILTPILIVIPISVLINNQIFISMGKEKLILMSTFTGAFVNLICNSILIPFIAENGAAIGTVIAETAVMFVCIHNAKKNIDINFKPIAKEYIYNILACLPILPFALILKYFINNPVAIVLLTIIFGSAIQYFILKKFKKNFSFEEI